MGPRVKVQNPRYSAMSSGSGQEDRQPVLTTLARLKVVDATLASLRQRLNRAKERGQVELHLNLSVVKLLLDLAEPLIRSSIETERAREAIAGETSQHDHGVPHPIQEDPEF